MDRPVPDYPCDLTVYLVVNDFGKFGKAYVETDIAEADREAIIRNFISGQYGNALRVVAFNTAEGWWSRDVSEDIANEVLECAFDADDNLSENTKRFIDRHVIAGEKRPRRPRCGAETIRPCARKPEPRIDFGRPWPDSGGHGNSRARARHQGRCHARCRRQGSASRGGGRHPTVE
jgi:hypothetical protein